MHYLLTGYCIRGSRIPVTLYTAPAKTDDCRRFGSPRNLVTKRNQIHLKRSLLPVGSCCTVATTSRIQPINRCSPSSIPVMIPVHGTKPSCREVAKKSALKHKKHMVLSAGEHRVSMSAPQGAIDKSLQMVFCVDKDGVPQNFLAGCGPADSWNSRTHQSGARRVNGMHAPARVLKFVRAKRLCVWKSVRRVSQRYQSPPSIVRRRHGPASTLHSVLARHPRI